jgi:hypothetical protein
VTTLLPKTRTVWVRDDTINGKCGVALVKATSCSVWIIMKKLSGISRWRLCEGPVTPAFKQVVHFKV